jgi:hypothetical protein
MIKLSVYHICKLVNDVETDEAEKILKALKQEHAKKSGFKVTV